MCIRDRSQDRPFRNITNLCCAHDSKKPKEPLISRSFTARQKENSTICLLEIKRTHPVRKTNPQLCEEYVEEIDGYLKRIEGMHKVDAEYMERQKEVNEYMRAVLVDWLVDVHIRFKLLSETLFLTVNIVDRYLEKERVKRDHLQLVGITACLIACKYEEIYPPEIKDFVYITNYTYTKEDILKLEQLILNSLQFNLNIPSSNRFLQRFSKSLGSPKKTTTLAQYLLELSLTELKMLKYSSSLIAAAALYTSHKLNNSAERWGEEMWRLTGQSAKTLSPCIKDMVVMLEEAPRGLQAVRKKFATVKYMEVSQVKICRKN
eukprot:TRINITY_DN10366_c0_g1_i12.p1 TRINITY_DN10366_c0_g1~~TRINITY_DN10366_c0_g1_i12.p1  ORF type:complete len:319 (-),score=95.69 TRINITY_DN10366_c0_g1_i12:138-1094(-)